MCAQAVSFVGGNAAGRYIYSRCADTGKRCQVNLGAKNHAVVLPDADVDSTVKALTGARMRPWQKAGCQVNLVAKSLCKCAV